VISMWTPVPQVDEGSSISWSRQVVIRRREIGRPLAWVLDAYQPILFSRFGERSGTVLFWMQRTGLSAGAEAKTNHRHCCMRLT
jgi:hypothetical protein